MIELYVNQRRHGVCSLTVGQEHDLCKEYMNGASCRALGLKFRISHQAALNILRANGCPVRTRTGHFKRKPERLASASPK